MSIVSRLVRFAVVPAVAGVLLVGCGSEPGLLSEEEAQRLIDELPEQAAAERFRFEIRQTFEGLDGIEVDPEAGLIVDLSLFSVLAEGGIDVPGERSWLHFEVPGAMMDLEAVFNSSEGGLFSPPEGFTGDPIPFTVDFVQDGDTSYWRFPFFTAFFGVDLDKWITAEAEGSEDDLLGLGEDFTFTPEQLTEYLSAVEGELEVVGDEEIRGAETTHIRATIALDAIDEENFFPAPPDGDMGTVPVDLWIDAEGRLHKLEFTTPMQVSGDGFLPLAEGSEPLGEVTATFSLWLFDYGQPIELTIPGPDEIVDEEELWGGFDFGIDEEEFTWTEEDEAFSNLWNALEYNLTLEDRERLETELPDLHEEYLALEETWYFSSSVSAEDVAALEALVARMSEALGHDLAAEPDYFGDTTEWTAEDEELFELKNQIWTALTDEDWERLTEEFPDLLDEFWALDEATWEREVTAEDVAALRDLIARMEAALGKDLGIE